MPGARYELIADAKHFPNVEDPEAFNRLMMGWLGSSIATDPDENAPDARQAASAPG